MKKSYGGLMSTPENKQDMILPSSRTITFSGTVVETPAPDIKPEIDYKNVVGSYVYSDKTLGSEVKDNIVGVVAIPANACPDGKARIIPITGAVNNKRWTNTELVNAADIVALGVQPINTFPYINNGAVIEGETLEFTTFLDNDGYGPQFWIEATQDLLDAWENGGLRVIQSEQNPSLYAAWLEGDFGDNDQYMKILPLPYLADGTINPQLSETLGGNNTITSDWESGDTNKTTLASNSELFSFVNEFSKDGFPAGTWSIPTTAELILIFAKYKTIYDAITNAGGDTSWMSNSSNYRYLWGSTFIGQYNEDDTGGFAWGGLVDDSGTGLYYGNVYSSSSSRDGLPLAKLN